MPLHLTPGQREALELLEQALQTGTLHGLFDVMAAFVHPDVINQFADACTQMHEELLSDDSNA